MTFSFIKTTLLLLACSFGNALYAQADNIDVFVKAEMKKRKIPGLQLAIVKNGKIIKTGNYGLANVQDSIPVSDRTVFTINSITKAFTGIAILQLVETGKLELSSPVAAYLSGLPEAWTTVTIQQLLSHISGIPDIVDEEESVLISPYGEAAAWKIVQAAPMDFIPGEKFRYNQTNYLLLGRIIDKLGAMPFAEFITKGQLQKVGMLRTITAGFGATKDVISHSAAGYRYEKGKLANMFFSFPPSLQTAAGMSSTAKELAAWIIALQNGQLLKEKTLALLWSPAKLNNGKTAGFNNLLNGYAAGWPVIIRARHSALAPVGGGRSAIFVYPEDNLSIIVLTNLSGGSPDAFIDKLAGFYIPDMKGSNEKP
jgi:CubicO group peptidase (beta-lactamase class C family)